MRCIYQTTRMMLALFFLNNMMIQPVSAQNDVPSSFESFLGAYQGEGAERFDLDRDNRYKSRTIRIELGRIDQGFRVQQTIRYNEKPEQILTPPKTNIIEHYYRHQSGDPLGLYRMTENSASRIEGAKALDPIAGGEIGWAVFHGSTLLLSRFQIISDGRWVVVTQGLTLDDGFIEEQIQANAAGQSPMHARGNLRQEY